jgi:hypothetical protein
MGSESLWPEVRLRIASLHMEEVLTTPQSPWQNPYAERVIGSTQRKCLDHFVILSARHLKRGHGLYISLTTTRQERIRGWASNVPMFGMSRVLEVSPRYPNSEDRITVMNALQHNAMSVKFFGERQSQASPEHKK